MILPHNPNAFARSPLDRAAHHRRDQIWLGAALKAANTRVIPFHKLRPFVIEQDRKAEAGWLGAHALGAAIPISAATLFLGLDKEGAAYFAADAPEQGELAQLGSFEDLRALGPRLPGDELAILGCAKSIFEWHDRHRFCSNCGAPSEVAEAGWKRICANCKAEHFPRVDPVAIMAPVFGDACLLGRQKNWPRGMYSALAGYVEPGETIEEAVARETLEEAGLEVREVTIHSNQPWPFPHSLMIGAIAKVVDNSEKIDTHELESGRWFSREEVRQMLAGNHPDAFCPPPFAIAHQILKGWAEGEA